MSKIYFHDAERKIVWAAPAEPDVTEKTDKRGNREGWFITARIDVTRADNYLKPNTHQWAFPVMESHHEHYDARDDRQSAIGYFKAFKYPHFPEITAEQYARIQAEYEAQALKNTPPSHGKAGKG